MDGVVSNAENAKKARDAYAFVALAESTMSQIMQATHEDHEFPSVDIWPASEPQWRGSCVSEPVLEQRITKLRNLSDMNLVEKFINKSTGDPNGLYYFLGTGLDVFEPLDNEYHEGEEFSCGICDKTWPYLPLFALRAMACRKRFRYRLEEQQEQDVLLPARGDITESERRATQSEVTGTKRLSNEPGRRNHEKKCRAYQTVLQDAATTQNNDEEDGDQEDGGLASNGTAKAIIKRATAVMATTTKSVSFVDTARVTMCRGCDMAFDTQKQRREYEDEYCDDLKIWKASLPPGKDTEAIIRNCYGYAKVFTAQLSEDRLLAHEAQCDKKNPSTLFKAVGDVAGGKQCSACGSKFTETARRIAHQAAINLQFKIWIMVPRQMARE